MDDRNLNNMMGKTNQFLENAQTSIEPGRIAPPLHIPSVHSVGNPMNLTAAAAAAAAAANAAAVNAAAVNAAAANAAAVNAAAANNASPRNSFRRVSVPSHQYMPSTTGSAMGYNGNFNNFPYRPYMNMNGYNPYGSFGQPAANQYQNPVVIAAAENSRPAFESIQSVVQSFNAVSMMLESTFTAMHMSFQALLGVAENFTRLRMFMMKLYSTIVSFKLARWFLTKIFYLLRMVRGNRGFSAEEDLWKALSSTSHENIPTDGRSWPLVVFTGLLVATPYFVYKLLNSVTPVTGNLTNASNALGSSVSSNSLPSNNQMRASPGVVIKSSVNWSSADPKTIALVKGQSYLTTQARLSAVVRNGGWLLVDDQLGQRGYVPMIMLVPPTRKPVNRPVPLPVIHGAPNVMPNVEQSIAEVNDDPITLPHTLVLDCD